MNGDPVLLVFFHDSYFADHSKITQKREWKMNSIGGGSCSGLTSIAQQDLGQGDRSVRI
jgi:hypothetical protein